MDIQNCNSTQIRNLINLPAVNTNCLHLYEYRKACDGITDIQSKEPSIGIALIISYRYVQQPTYEQRKFGKESNKLVTHTIHIYFHFWIKQTSLNAHIASIHPIYSIIIHDTRSKQKESILCSIAERRDCNERVMICYCISGWLFIVYCIASRGQDWSQIISGRPRVDFTVFCVCRST